MVQSMNDTLNSIFVRLDVSLQNLSSKAIAQIIIENNKNQSYFGRKLHHSISSRPKLFARS